MCTRVCACACARVCACVCSRARVCVVCPVLCVIAYNYSVQVVYCMYMVLWCMYSMCGMWYWQAHTHVMLVEVTPEQACV